MKATLFVTQDCNLACDYCYISKRAVSMDLSTARRVLDFIQARAAEAENVDIGFFGGEPLLALPLVLEIARMARSHPVARDRKLDFQLITNGTLLDSACIEALGRQGIGIGISCDGPSFFQDAHRRYRDGSSSAVDVDKAIRLAVQILPQTMVNAVYRPDSIAGLEKVVSYFYGLGVRAIFLNPDFRADWSEADVAVMRKSYAAVAELFRAYHLAGDPARVSLIDAKIALLLNGGYSPHERCSMGRRELAFGPEGAIYPCERLAGDCLTSEHRIGSLEEGIVRLQTCVPPVHADTAGGSSPGATPCQECSIGDYCMHWCGCSNFFSTGSYNRPGAFLCASEKEALRQASRVLACLSEEIGPEFMSRL